MDREKLIKAVAEFLGVSTSEKNLAFEIFINKITQVIGFNEALRIPNIGIFQLKKEKSGAGDQKGSVSKIKNYLLFSPAAELFDENTDSVYFRFDVSGNKIGDVDFDESVFSLSVSKPIIPLQNLSNPEISAETSYMMLRKAIEARIDESIADANYLRNFDLFEDYIIPNKIKTEEESIHETDTLLTDETDVTQKEEIITESISENEIDSLKLNDEIDYENSDSSENSVNENIFDEFSSVPADNISEENIQEEKPEEEKTQSNFDLMDALLSDEQEREVDKAIVEELNSDSLPESDLPSDENNNSTNSEIKNQNDNISNDLNIEDLLKEEDEVSPAEMLETFEKSKDDSDTDFDIESLLMGQRDEEKATNNSSELSDKEELFDLRQDLEKGESIKKIESSENNEKELDEDLIFEEVKASLDKDINEESESDHRKSDSKISSEEEDNTVSRPTFSELRKKKATKKLSLLFWLVLILFLLFTGAGLYLYFSHNEWILNFFKSEKPTEEFEYNPISADSLIERQNKVNTDMAMTDDSSSNIVDTTKSPEDSQIEIIESNTPDNTIIHKPDFEERIDNSRIYFDGVKYSVQLSAWQNLDKATEEMNKHIKKGYKSFLTEFVDEQNRTWYRVRIGYYDDIEQAKSIANKF